MAISPDAQAIVVALRTLSFMMAGLGFVMALGWVIGCAFILNSLEGIRRAVEGGKAK